MFDRHLLRDAAFAVLLGLPTLALARPQADTPPNAGSHALVEQAAEATQTPAERRFTPSAER